MENWAKLLSEPAVAEIKAASTVKELEAVRLKWLGRNGIFPTIFRELWRG